MSTICENIQQIKSEIGKVQLVVVSKYRSLDELMDVYDCGHRHFGENRVQELADKASNLPSDIKWHLIGHLQTNKVKYIAPFVHLIHSVDSLKLLRKINQEAIKNNRVISFLFQLHIAEEESKFGLSISELKDLLASEEYGSLTHVQCKGLMAMATNTEDEQKLRAEFKLMHGLYSELKEKHSFDSLSLGMSGDYQIAIEEGSNMIRIGSKIFA